MNKTPFYPDKALLQDPAKMHTDMEAEVVQSPEAAAQEWAGEMRYVARQPILNQAGTVHGYELLFRNGPMTVAPRDGNMPARTMLDNAVMFGLEQFTNGLPAFVNCSVESLTEDLVNVLNPSRTVLGIPASLGDAPKLVDACRELKAHGFKLLLDEFKWNANQLPLIKLADYIRLDSSQMGPAERYQLQRLKGDSVAKIAEKLKTQEDYRLAVANGFTLFQGEYFCNPELLKKSRIPASPHAHFDIVRLLCNDPIDVRRISLLVMRDAALTYRLLRVVNSPLYAVRNEVRSIESAIIILGDDTFRRVVSLAILSELKAGAPPEIMHMSFIRARFCEMAAKLCSLSPAEQYLLGMFSLATAMLRIPMEEFTRSLPLRKPICEALEGRKNHERSLLTWLELREKGEWEASAAAAQGMGVSEKELNLFYVDAVVWAQVALTSAATRG